MTVLWIVNTKSFSRLAGLGIRHTRQKAYSPPTGSPCLSLPLVAIATAQVMCTIKQANGEAPAHAQPDRTQPPTEAAFSWRQDHALSNQSTRRRPVPPALPQHEGCTNVGCNLLSSLPSGQRHLFGSGAGMSEALNNGGPAFPMQDSQAIHAYAIAKVQGLAESSERDQQYMKARAEAIGGMSLRDYYAGQALTGLLHFWTMTCSLTGEIRDPKTPELAKQAFEMADAMLKAREAT